ncbi:FecR family protein [Hymenobacter terricola]|uniref:FecR family protein n=1 Tax=Hymenobacter terricola TaxID=2819236 RepID=UPI001B309AE2|nr:FecR domain-containing protein [Hymenobacter terricola]
MESEEFYSLITRYLARQTSSDENERLATWVAQSPDHERTFEQLKAIWQASQTPAVPAETAAALRNVKARLALPVPAPAPPPTPPIRRWRMARPYQLAALALVLLSGLCGAYFFRKPASPQAYQVRQTRAGEQQLIHLADGSLVTLAPKSRLRYPTKFSETSREVYLEGEAFFEVSKNPHRPFRVHSGTWVTQVLGTKFNVSAFRGAGQTAVSLVEGQVRVTDEHEQYLLAPGQQLLADRATGRIYRQAFNPTKVTGWRGNKLVFQNEKLADVAAQIERLYGVKLVFADPATAEVRLWATFDNEPLAAVLAALQLAGPLTYRREGQVIYLQQPPPGTPAN